MEIFIEQQELPDNNEMNTEDGKTDLRQVSRLQVGAGDNVFYSDKDGSRWGSMDFDKAGAFIKMDGSYQFKDDSGNIVLDKGGVTKLISDTLNTQTAQILGEYTFNASGAIKIANDSNNGMWISPSGILGKKSGSTVFALDNGGNLTLKGTLLAGSVVACDITGVNLSSSSGSNRIQMTNGDRLRMYYNNILGGELYSESDGDLKIWARDDIIFHTQNQGKICQIKDAGIIPDDDNQFDLGSDIDTGGKAWRTIYGRIFNANGKNGITTTDDLVTSVWKDGSDLRYNYRRFEFVGGILIGKSSTEYSATACGDCLV